MKTFWFTLLGLVLLIGAAVCIAESGWGKKLALGYATRGLKKSGIEIEAKSSSGEELRDVEVRGQGWTIRAKSLRTEIAWIRLLRGEIDIRAVKLTGLELPGGKTIDVEGRVRVGRRIRIDAESEGFVVHVEGKGGVWKGEVKGQVLSGEMAGVWENGKWDGAGVVKGPGWEAKGNVNWTGSELVMGDWTVQGEAVQGSGTWRVNREGIVEGDSELTVERMQDFGLPVFGSVQGKILFRGGECGQAIYADLQMRDLFWKELFLEEAKAQVNLFDPFGTLSIGAEIDTGNGHLRTLEITAIHAKMRDRDFTGNGEGFWRHPLELQGSGHWNYEAGAWHCVLQTLSGQFADHPVLLAQSVAIAASKDSFAVEPFEMRIGDSSAAGKWSSSGGGRGTGEFALRHIPIDLFSHDVSVGGTLDLDANVAGPDFRLDTRLNGADIGSGTLAASSHEGVLEATVDIAPLLSTQITLSKDGALTGRLSFQGQIEKLLDYFNLGTHRFEGDIDCSFVLGGTLDTPLLEGNAVWKKGIYQNYFTGTSLRHIEAHLLAQGGEVRLQSLQGEDDTTGKIACTGRLELEPRTHFPFRFQMNCSDLRFVEIDLVAARASGEVSVAGSGAGATATGTLSIQEAIITIPDHIPRQLPHLQVVYRHPIHPTLPAPAPSTPYPLHLNLTIDAPQHIFITGRGLQSEWKGTFALSGTISSPAAQGKLELLNGDFEFSSRRFKLSEGALSLSGKEHEMPHLNIAASVEEKGVVITARLKGPLNKPQLTFQSVPPLPMSSILAYLLFGQEISEINGLQALQLANAAASLSGQTPDVLENTRRSLGVDRLRIITVPSGAEEGEDAIALQVGKYVARGVIISVSQGAEDSSSNISIEVELKHGFVFQAETQQQQEQGKFTIKWTQSY